MTQYFDDYHLRIKDAQEMDELDDLEQELVDDCLLATQLSGFPEGYASKVFDTVLHHSFQALPDRVPASVEPEGLGARRKGVSELCWGLHSVFHAVAEAGGISDSPVVYKRAMIGHAETAMLQHVEASFDQPVNSWGLRELTRLVNFIALHDTRHMPVWMQVGRNGSEAVLDWWERPQERGAPPIFRGFAVTRKGDVYAPEPDSRWLGRAQCFNDVAKLFNLKRW